MEKLTYNEAKWRKMKRTTAENGDEFIPMKTHLGVYYLRFHKPAGIAHFVVWRTNELELSKHDILVGILAKDAIKSDRDNFSAKDMFWFTFEEIDIMREMAKKL